MGFFNGHACSEAIPEEMSLRGFLNARAGLFLSSMSCCTVFSECLKIYRLLSILPKMFDAALNLVPFTFSNNKAGPPPSWMRK